MKQYAGKPIDVMIRTPAEMARVLAGNPFPNAAPNRVVAIFLNDAPPADTLGSISGQKGEQMALGEREIYVHYGDGMADFEAENPCGEGGHGPQSQHCRQARRHGGEVNCTAVA